VPPLAAALMRPGTRRPDVLLPLLALSAWTAAEALAEDDAANLAAARGQHQDRGTRYAMVGAHLLAWWLPLLNAPRRHRWPSGPATGVALILAGGGLRVLAIRTLGSRFTGHVRTVPQQPVCDHGPYALVRHPSYLGLLGLNAGPALSRGAWPAALGAAAATMAANACRVRVEEQALLTQLGQPYADYAARTPRFVPRLRARDEQRPLTEQSQNLV
jgi:protein-S-isoprenylcysteine O-methyltransferase Ste14